MKTEYKYEYWIPDSSGRANNVETHSHSVIFIGANGAGKSRLGAWIEQQDTQAKVHRIGAQRDINFNDYIPLKSYSESENLVLYGNAEFENRKNKIFKYGQPDEDRYTTKLISDFNYVLSALIAKNNNENENFIEECRKASENGKTDYPPVPTTDIKKLINIWEDIFPQRELIFRDSQFFAKDPNVDNGIEYSATKMSDGERSALYFIAQVLCVPNDKILLIDEPEVHLHRSLINRLWTTLENYRQDCLFIYITHDTQFAAMHTDADKYWVKSFMGNNIWDIERISDEQLPEDLLLELLGNRKNVLFVEGTAGSYDIQLFSLIYKNYYIVPCGSCTQVIEITKAFNKTKMLHHYQAYGIIDRDYRSDNEINKLKNHHIFTLEVAEIENLFLVEELIRAVSEAFGYNANQIFEDVSKYIIQERFKKQINRQICSAIVSELKYQLSCIDLTGKSEDDIQTTLDNKFHEIPYDEIKKNVEDKFNKAEQQGYKQILRIFNEKNLSQSIGHFWNIENKGYCKIVISMLKNGKIDPQITIGKYMPSESDIPRFIK